MNPITNAISELSEVGDSIIDLVSATISLAQACREETFELKKEIAALKRDVELLKGQLIIKENAPLSPFSLPVFSFDFSLTGVEDEVQSDFLEMLVSYCNLNKFSLAGEASNFTVEIDAESYARAAGEANRIDSLIRLTFGPDVKLSWGKSQEE